jgi:hypothetical protein
MNIGCVAEGCLHFTLVRTADIETKVLGLDRGEGGELGVNVVQVKLGDLLVKSLGQDVDTNGAFALVAELNVLGTKGSIASLVQGNLGQDLVGERARHDEGRVASSTTQVDETTLSQENDVATAGHEEAVNLGLDVLGRLGVGLQPGNVDLDIKVTNVANNGVVGHGLEVATNKDVTATGGGDEDLANRGGLLHGSHLVTGDSSLQSVDGVNLSDNDTGTHAVEGLGTTLADVTETGNNGDLASNHNIGGTLDTIDERFTATVQVVELGLGDRVVDVDGRNKELVILEHAVQVVDTSGGLLGDTVAVLELLGVLLVDKASQVTTVVEDKVELLAILEGSKLLLQAPFVLLVGLTLPGEATSQSLVSSTASRTHRRYRNLTYTGTPAAAMAAAAWSWVEKMLQLVQVTSAPRAVRVSMRTAVWMVMCKQPAMRAPARGWSAAYLVRMAIRPGISISARSISRRPKAARD